MLSKSLFRTHPKFLAWNALSSFIGGANFAISTHSMLHAINIDNQLITASASFIGKDVVGQLGTVLFAYSGQNKKSDIDPVKHGIKMALLMATCTFAENLTPIVPEYFVPIASISTVGKNMGMIGIGSISMKCINKLSSADGSNDTTGEGEIYGKIVAQNSVFSSLGMMSGMMITHLIPDHHVRLYTVIPLTSFLQIYSYKKSIQCLF